MHPDIADVLAGRRRWCVVTGDAFEVLPHVPMLPAIVTDVPYGIGAARDGGVGSSNLAEARDYGDDDWDDAPLTDEQMDAIVYAAHSVIVFGGNYYRMPPSSCWLVWDKVNTGGFADAELAWTNLRKAVRLKRFMWNGMLRENQEPRGDHPTQKPVGVMLWCIGHLPADVDLVCDPMCGSGTTGVAAIQLGKRFIGIEREEKYATIARRRIAEADTHLFNGVMA